MAAHTITVSRDFTCRWCPSTRRGLGVVTIHTAHAIVAPCTDCQAQGIGSFKVRATEADMYIAPVVTTTWQHSDGLVSFNA